MNVDYLLVELLLYGILMKSVDVLCVCFFMCWTRYEINKNTQTQCYRTNSFNDGNTETNHSSWFRAAPVLTLSLLKSLQCLHLKEDLFPGPRTSDQKLHQRILGLVHTVKFTTRPPGGSSAEVSGCKKGLQRGREERKRSWWAWQTFSVVISSHDELLTARHHFLSCSRCCVVSAETFSQEPHGDSYKHLLWWTIAPWSSVRRQKTLPTMTVSQ